MPCAAGGGSTFAYMQSNHTSVVGMWPVAAKAGTVCYSVAGEVVERGVDRESPSVGRCRVVSEGGRHSAVGGGEELKCVRGANGVCTGAVDSEQGLKEASSHSFAKEMGGDGVHSSWGEEMHSLRPGATGVEAVHIPAVGTTPPALNLFGYPAQCNLTGRRYPLAWVKHVQVSGIVQNMFFFLNRERFFFHCSDFALHSSYFAFFVQQFLRFEIT